MSHDNSSSSLSASKTDDVSRRDELLLALLPLVRLLARQAARESVEKEKQNEVRTDSQEADAPAVPVAAGQ